jgi:hypothetical protein
MKNRDMPANPNKHGVRWIDENDQVQSANADGLTKLEYAAIHIHAARYGRTSTVLCKNSIAEAHELFDQLEKQETE